MHPSEPCDLRVQRSLHVGVYPPGTLHALAEQRLREFAQVRQQFARQRAAINTDCPALQRAHSERE